MKKILYFLLPALLIAGCIKENDTEEEMPGVELLLPAPCDTLYFGEAFHYTVKVSDQSGLGDLSMDMHNNFGHHDHGDHETCNMDEVKEAVNPYSNSWLFSLPDNEKVYVFDTLLTIPVVDEDSVQYDAGDYHFHIYVTDNDGYQTFTTMDVKILNK